MKWRGWRGVSLIFLLLLLLLAVTLAWIVSTQSGLRWVVQRANAWVPGLHIAAVSGSLTHLRFSDISYRQPGVDVALAQAGMTVDVRCLLNSRLCISQLSIQGAAVRVETAALTKEAQQPAGTHDSLPDLTLPYPIQLEKLAIDRLKVKIDGNSVQLQQLRSTLRWQRKNLTVGPTTLRDLQVVLAAQSVTNPPPSTASSAMPQGTLPLEKRLQQLFSRPLLAELTEFTLPLNITLADLTAEQLNIIAPGLQPLPITSLKLSGDTGQSRIQISSLRIDSPLGHATLAGQATLGQGWPLDIKMTGMLAQAPLTGEALSLSINGALQQQVKLQLQLRGPLEATLQGQLQTGTAGLPLALSWQSKQLQWPLTGAGEYRLTESTVTLKGKASDYQLALKGHLAGAQIPEAQISLLGAGNLSGFNLQQLQVKALQGVSDLSGTLDWRNGLSWQGRLALSGINSKKQYPDWPLTLNGVIHTAGKWQGENWQIAMPQIRLEGAVAQGALQLTGSLAGESGGRWQVDTIRLRMGENHLFANGKIDRQMQLDLNLDAPQLKGTLPGLSGSAQGKVRLRGQLSEPQATVQLAVDQLRLGLLQLDRARLTGQVQSRQQVEGEIKAELSGLQSASLQLKNVLLTLQGSERQHQLMLKMAGKPIAGALSLQGNFNRQQQRWQGTLGNARVDTPAGTWLLQKNLPLEYAPVRRQIQIGAHCWTNSHGQICLPVAAKVGAQGEARILLERLDLTMLRPWLPPTTRLQGAIRGEISANWRNVDQLPLFKLNLQGESIKLVQQIREEEALPVLLQKLTLAAEARPGQARVEWLLNLANNGEFNGNLRILDPETGGRNLAGQIRLDSLSLAAIQPLLPQDEKIKGVLQGNLQLGGRLSRPAVTGTITLDQWLMSGHSIPISMQPSRLQFNFRGYHSHLTGSVRTAQRQLNLSGDSDWEKWDIWRTRLAAKGDKLRVVIPPMIRLDASPDLLFEASPDGLQLTGTVTIPWARFVVQELPENAVAVSDDQVMLNDSLLPLERKSLPIHLNSQVKLALGNHVQLNAFGLKSRLSGNLLLNQDQKGLGAHGQITLENGRFHAYGQDLLIRRGNLLFSGNIQQPLLDIEAIRNPDATENNVVVGVRVSGLADSPQAEVFSNPAMSEQEALSYLMRGQGLNTGADEGSMMTSMLIGMGAAKSGKLIGQIGETFGISNLSLDTEGAGDKSQVVVSGYILPGLQVKYGVGLFDSLATLTLRYRLMPKLYLEALSGVDLALDLLYQFEF